MKFVQYGFLFMLFLSGVFPAAAQSDPVNFDPNLKIWFDTPAQEWNEAFPLGNGHLGAMVFGSPAEEHYQLNEDTLWTGGPHDYTNPEAAKYLPEMRRLILEGKEKEAEKLGGEHLMSRPDRLQSYQPFNDLWITFPGHDQGKEYRRELDLLQAKAIVSYRVGGLGYTRESFISYPDKVLVVRLTAESKGTLSFRARLTCPHPDAQITREAENQLLLIGKMGSTPGDKGGNGKWDGEGLKFASLLHVGAEGGRITSQDNNVVVENADSATVLLTNATNYINYKDISGDPAGWVRTQIAAAREKDYSTLFERHLEDYEALFNRVSLDLGENEATFSSTNMRLTNYSIKKDPQLAALYFQFGRYLLIASSRPGSQPANLQGIWNDRLDPSWGSKWTTNINTEMNYWPVESTNLSECHEPMLRMIEDLHITGAHTAEVNYQCRGWVLHHNTDLWRAAAPVDGPWGIWPMGAAWISQDMWEHYAFTGDKEFLKSRAYPVMKDAALFILDFLTPAPEKSRFAGKLITVPSHSPENNYKKANGETVAQTYSATMDTQIILDLFRNCIEASEILGDDEAFRTTLRETTEKLIPMQISKSGRLQEWVEDYAEPEPGHRHMSHMFGLYPGRSISMEETPKLAAAARKSLDTRLRSGGGGTGWSRAWLVGLFARLSDGDKAAEQLDTLFHKSTLPNLFDNHPPFQIDGNFGATAGIAEMLLQSHTGVIQLLPALPSEWPNGSVKGLCARGGITADIAWSEGKLSRAVIHTRQAGIFTLAYGKKKLRLEAAAGADYMIDENLTLESH